MTTTKADRFMDIFSELGLLYQLDEEDLEEVSTRINIRLDSLIMWARQTKLDRELEQRSDNTEETKEQQEVREFYESD